MTLNGHFTLNYVFQVQNLLIYLHGQRNDIYSEGINNVFGHMYRPTCRKFVVCTKLLNIAQDLEYFIALVCIIHLTRFSGRRLTASTYSTIK